MRRQPYTPPPGFEPWEAACQLADTAADKCRAARGHDEAAAKAEYFAACRHRDAEHDQCAARIATA